MTGCFYTNIVLTCTRLLCLVLLSQDDFDVDQFVAECRKQVQMEEMREDLELYYKLLKTAMVELINKDYADFVNLSTNLVSNEFGCTFWTLQSAACSQQ